MSYVIPALEPVNLKHGSKTNNVQDVKVWQTRLRLDPDGVFGPLTRSATVAHCKKLVESTGLGGRVDGVVDDTVWLWSGLSYWSRRVPVPLKVNVAGCRPARQSTMLSLFGAPADKMTVQCAGVTNLKLKAQMVYSHNVGPFKVSGLDRAVAEVANVLAMVKLEQPDLYKRLGTQGMLCCRAVRGSTQSWSNHSFGTAIDIDIDGQTDSLGDGYAQVGLLALTHYFNVRGFYHGAEFSREDSMHFEAGEALVREWAKGL